MNRATQQEILEAVVTRLRACVPEYTDLTCFVSDHPTPVSFPAGPVCCTVSLGSGTFPEPFFAGGGHLTLCEQTTLLVAPYVRSKLDKPAQTTQIMLNETKGLVSRFKPAILKALLVDDSSGTRVTWQPLDTTGNRLLRSNLAPANCSAAAPDASGEFMGMILAFSVEFDWRL